MKLIIKIFISGYLIFYCLFSYSQTWETDFVDSIWGGNANVYALYNYQDDLYIGGPFRYVDTLLVNGITKWDGINWHNYGEGITGIGGAVECISVFYDRLYIGGGFSEVDYQPDTEHLARWFSNSWHSLAGLQSGSTVYDLKVFNDTLFVAGNSGYGVYAFNGNEWIYVGEMNTVWTRALGVFNGELYAGGYFGLKRYLGGTSWEEAHGGVDGRVNKMVTDTFNNFLYVGGAFYSVADTVVTRDVAMWDGFKWNSLGWIINCDVYDQAMAVYRGDLYIGGCMDELENGLDVNYITRWDGEKWDSLGCGVNNAVSALEVHKDELYVGGYFTEAGGLPAYGLARWHMPDTGCGYIKPHVYTLADTFYLSGGTADVQFYNNNAYVDSWDWDFDDSGNDTIQNPLHTYTDTGTYNIVVTITHNSCVKTAEKTITIKGDLGINDQLQDAGYRLHIYPNPTNDSFIAEVETPSNSPGGGESYRINIYGLNGTVKTSYGLHPGMNRIEIRTSGWQAGKYLCCLMNGGRMIRSERLIITR